MSGGGSKSKSKSSAGFDQNVWGPQSDALQQLYGQLPALFGQVQSGLNQQVGNASNYMNQIQGAAVPAWQQQLQGGAYQGMDIQNQLMNSLNQSMNSPTATQEINNMIMGGAGNNYADAMRNQYTQDATRAQENMLANLDARAAASGMSGGSRHGVATAQGMRDINQNLQNNMANVGYQTFDKDLDRKLQIAGQADQGTLARQNMLQNMLGQQQGAMQSGLGFGSQMQQLGMGSFAPYMMPWQNANAYSGVLGSPTVLSSGSQGGKSKGGSKAASLGGGG